MECMRDHFQHGTVLDNRFRTVAPLNHGSFGMVFLAEDRLTRQEVAVKCLTKGSVAPLDLSMSYDEGAEELSCHKQLGFHPHLVNLIHNFETHAHAYLVLEYCSQGDLYEAIRGDRGPLQTDHVRQFMLQLIGAVEHMHKKGLYHRDIKPENIFITASGDLKLGDFGLATRDTWSYESCVGSDRYMAPEQYDHLGNGYSPAHADIWSIGICLLNILFSRNPFVTPTESDVLFADYVRDRKSLFDVFPNMSNDTFSILSNALSLDPTKRDLHALRAAIQQAVCFTFEDEDLDEFCTEERDVVRASANREPLRTPSIASPQMDSDSSFPWAQVLHTTPAKPIKHMPSIPDEYEEDLFSDKAHGYGQSWFSGRYNTPSTVDSAFGASFASMHIPAKAMKAKRPILSTVPSSLPVQRTRPIPTMAQIFSKKETVAKSWSDMWDEDEEEEEMLQLQTRRELNARSFSHESVKDIPPVPVVPLELKKPSALNTQVASKTPRKVSSSSKLDENDPYSWQPKTPRRASPKQVPMDKWAALGNRRRAPTNPEVPASANKKTLTSQSFSKKRNGSNTNECPFNRRSSRNKSNKSRPAYLNQDWRQQKVIDSSEDEDHEWVGGWQHFHL